MLDSCSLQGKTTQENVLTTMAPVSSLLFALGMRNLLSIDPSSEESPAGKRSSGRMQGATTFHGSSFKQIQLLCFPGYQASVSGRNCCLRAGEWDGQELEKHHLNGALKQLRALLLTWHSGKWLSQVLLKQQQQKALLH